MSPGHRQGELQVRLDTLQKATCQSWSCLLDGWAICRAGWRHISRRANRSDFRDSVGPGTRLMFTETRCWLTRRSLPGSCSRGDTQSSPSRVTMLLSRSLRAVSPLIAAGRPAARSLSSAAPSSRRLDLSGIYPPIATPFTAGEDVDHDKLRENVHKYAEIPFRGQRSRSNVALRESSELPVKLCGLKFCHVHCKSVLHGPNCHRGSVTGEPELSGLVLVAILWPLIVTTCSDRRFFSWSISLFETKLRCKKSVKNNSWAVKRWHFRLNNQSYNNYSFFFFLPSSRH